MAGAEVNKLKQYLLGQLTEAEDEQVELRLLTEPDFAEEYDIVVNEVIDDYISGKFEAQELKQVEEYFFKSPERKKKLKFALALKQRKSEMVTIKGYKQKTYRPYLAIAATLLLVVGAFFTWRALSSRNQVDEGLAALQSAFRDERPLEARISNLNYARYITTRGPEEERGNQNDLRRAELTLLQALKDNPTPAAHHALGKIFLVKKDFDRAIKEFDQALKADPNNAQLYSDLGAAWLEKGRIDRDGKDPGKGLGALGKSLDYLNKALELNPQLLEALFNRALSRQLQGLYVEAEADWREYIRRDPNSLWATEANPHLKLIEKLKIGGASNQPRPLDIFLSAYQSRDDQRAWEIYRRSHSQTGNTITNSLIDALLRESGNSNSSTSWDPLAYLGQLQLNKTGDLYDSNLAKFYGSATPKERAVLVQARQKVTMGYDLFRKLKITDALELFSQAREAFTAIGNDGEALLAECAIANAAAIQPDLEKSEQIMARIIPICEAKGYKWLLAQCLVQRAHLQSSRNNYSEAIDDSSRALEIFEDNRDYNGAMGVFVQLASLHLYLNDNEQSLSFVQRGLTMAEKDRGNPTDMWGLYIAASLNFDNQDLNRAAFDYQTEALGLALDSRVPLYRARSYEYLGITYGKLQRYDEAIKNVRRAFEEGQTLASDRSGQSMMARASLKLGDLYRASGHHAQALDAYEESTRLYEQLDIGHYRYLSHKGKLLTLVAERNNDGVAQELPIVLELFDEYRTRILEERQRSFFFDKEQDVYDIAVDFASARGDASLAFDYSERSRSRSLLDLMRNGGLVVERNGRFDFRVTPQLAKSLNPEEIKESMPDRVQLLQYAVLKDRVVIWLVTRSDVTARSTSIDSLTLAAGVANCLRVIATSDDSEAANQLARLYDVLIKPVADLLNKDKWLLIVPDKELSHVPFAALLSNTSGRYLVQDFRLTLSPSSSVFINCTTDAERKNQAKAERLLAVGNPSFDREDYPQYTYLTAAQREATDIAALYPSRRILVKDSATVSAVKAELQRSDVAHFAGHYVIDPLSSLSSRLLLAKTSSRQDSGELQAREVFELDVSRMRLVVLSACETGIEGQFKGEGPISFARQFIVAGVPVVVASIWAVDSEATAQLMTAFHRHRQVGGMPTAQALGQAQKDLIESSDSRYRRPYYWAAFMTIGGYAEY